MIQKTTTFAKNKHQKLITYYEYICTDLWQHIFTYLDLLCQLRLMSTNKFMYKNLKIFDMYNVTKKYKLALTNEILKQKKFKDIVSLDISGNNHVTDINHLAKIKYLNMASYGMHGCCVMQDSGIVNLNPVELVITKNKFIHNIDHMTNLKYLNTSTIGFSNISPEYLVCDYFNIKSIKMTKNLRCLSLQHCLVSELEMSDPCNIEYINLSFSHVKFKKLSVFKNLKFLSLCNTDLYNNNDIKDLSVEHLNITCNNKITSVKGMKKLKHLVMRCRIAPFDVDSLCDMDIEYIDISYSCFEGMEKLIERKKNIIFRNTEYYIGYDICTLNSYYGSEFFCIKHNKDREQSSNFFQAANFIHAIDFDC